MNKRSYKRGYRREIIGDLLKYGLLPYGVYQIYDDKIKSQWQRKVKILEREGIVSVRHAIDGSKYITLNDYKNKKENYIDDYPAAYRNNYESQEMQMKIRTLAMGAGELARDIRAEYISRQSKILNDIYANYIVEASNPDMIKENKWRDIKDLKQSDSAYYISGEIKRLKGYKDKQEIIKADDEDGIALKKLFNSRINGLAIMPGGYYSVYTAIKTLTEWKRAGEVRITAYIKSVLNDCLPWFSVTEEIDAIVLAKNNKLFANICQLDYTNSRRDNGTRRRLINIDYAFKRMYAVPYDKDGVSMLKIMNIPLWDRIIKKNIIPMEDIYAASETSIDCDGYDKENGIYKLCFCVPDLVKLKNFVRRARLEDDKKKFIVYCYTHQIDLVLKLARDSVTVKKINIDVVENLVCKKEEP